MLKLTIFESKTSLSRNIAGAIFISLALAMLLTRVASARRVKTDDAWLNPACLEPTTTLTGNAYEEYIKQIRGTDTYEYIAADCPSCNSAADSAPKKKDDEDDEDPAPSTAPSLCTPTYAPPIATLSAHSPKNPLTIGQDPDDLGFDVWVGALGGLKTNTCTQGPDQQIITVLRIDGVELSAASVTWITGELAERYPGTEIKGSYPLTPNPTVTGLNTHSATLLAHIDPLDPGEYVLQGTAAQDDGQVIPFEFTVAVALLETTLTKPETGP